MWSLIAKEFPEKTENQIKNRFYSTLRRVATKKVIMKKTPSKRSIKMSKSELLKFLDEAIEYGHTCYSNTGRRYKRNHRKTSKKSKMQNNELEPLPSIRDILDSIPEQFPKSFSQLSTIKLEPLLLHSLEETFSRLNVLLFQKLGNSQYQRINSNIHEDINFLKFSN